MRTIAVIITLFAVTPPLALIVIIASMFGVKAVPGRGRLYNWAERTWAQALARAAGMRIHVHGMENATSGTGARVVVSNHTSWFDVFAVAAVLNNYTWIAKQELRRIPIFGAAAEAVGIIFIERTNRKAAFDAYRDAASAVQEGRSAIVCPEGTRGYDYRLRSFKKGPFVLAITAQARIVPTVVYGAIEIQRKGSIWVRPGDVHVHFLEPIDSAGYVYEQREELMQLVWKRMAAALRDIYGVESGDRPAPDSSAPIPTSFL